MSARATVLGWCPSRGAVFLRKRRPASCQRRCARPSTADACPVTPNRQLVGSVVAEAPVRTRPSRRPDGADCLVVVVAARPQRRGPQTRRRPPPKAATEGRHGRPGGVVRCGGADEEAEVGAVELTEAEVAEIEQAEDVEDVEVEEEAAVEEGVVARKKLKEAKE